MPWCLTSRTRERRSPSGLVLGFKREEAARFEQRIEDYIESDRSTDEKITGCYLFADEILHLLHRVCQSRVELQKTLKKEDIYCGENGSVLRRFVSAYNQRQCRVTSSYSELP